jgi:hypothetical protein
MFYTNWVFKNSNIFLYEKFVKLWPWYENFKKTLIHINALSIWKYKKSNYNCTFIIFSYIWVGAWHLLSCTYNLKNALKCILEHAIIQYYAMKSKIFFLLIIKVKNIHEFNILNLSLWILSTKKKGIFHWHTSPCFHLVKK